MRPSRTTRRSALLAGLAGMAAANFATAQRDAWPSRAVVVVVPFPPGGATDVVARVLAQGLAPRLGQQVVVENRSGATGTIGSAFVARPGRTGTPSSWAA